MIYFWVEMILKTEYHWRGKKTQRIKELHAQAVICESGASVVYAGWHSAVCTLGVLVTESLGVRSSACAGSMTGGQTPGQMGLSQDILVSHTQRGRESFSLTHTHIHAVHTAEHLVPWSNVSTNQCSGPPSPKIYICWTSALLRTKHTHTHTHKLQYNYSSTSSLLIKVTIPVTIFYSHVKYIAIEMSTFERSLFCSQRLCLFD